MGEMSKSIEEIRSQLKELLVSNLSLEDIRAEDIKDDEILFGEGLGLDSLDGVEIVVLLQRNFGLDVKDMKEGREIFNSLETLTQYVYTKLKEVQGDTEKKALVRMELQ